jgi:SAM-dependent methyltransferase
LGKGRFYAHCGIDERKRRGSREHARDHKGAKGGDEIACYVDAQHLGAEPRLRQSRRPVAASQIQPAGRRRAIAEGLTNCKFQEGDASNLHDLKDRSFDLVVSIFGAMFAPKPFDVAKEMVRVTRPGGRVVMGNWIPHDPTLVAQILKISTAYSPPPPEGFVSPMTWGIESNVIERFAATGVPKENVSFLKDTYTFNFPGPPSEFVAAFRKYYGPTMNAFAAAEKDSRAGDLQKELEVLFNSQNRSPNKASTSIPATFLRVTVARN